MAVIELIRGFLSEMADIEILALFAFIPARYSGIPEFALPGGLGAQVWTFVTYALLHGGWMHLGMNLVWLLAFGTPVARRFGTARFLAFCVVTAAAGALAHLLSYPGAMVPMIGASAVVSGAMAAAVRFAFAPGGPLGPMNYGRSGFGRSGHLPAVPLVRALREPRVLVFIAVWVGLNFLFGVAVSLPGTEGAEVAWQAHLGGFFAGLLLFSLFDPPAPEAHRTAFPL
nr:rhomboid family intramembrane serine protease [Aquabacter cavernae]